MDQERQRQEQYDAPQAVERDVSHGLSAQLRLADGLSLSTADLRTGSRILPWLFRSGVHFSMLIIFTHALQRSFGAAVLANLPVGKAIQQSLQLTP